MLYGDMISQRWLELRCLSVCLSVCLSDQAVVDGPDLLWADPHAVPQLTRGRLREGPSRLGVGPLMVSAVEAQERGYRVRLSDGRLELRVPLASPGLDVTVRRDPQRAQGRPERGCADPAGGPPS